MIFFQNKALFIMVEFASDRRSPCESVKNEKMCAHGLNWKKMSILRSFLKAKMKISLE